MKKSKVRCVLQIGDQGRYNKKIKCAVDDRKNSYARRECNRNP